MRLYTGRKSRGEPVSTAVFFREEGFEKMEDIEIEEKESPCLCKGENSPGNRETTELSRTDEEEEALLEYSDDFRNTPTVAGSLSYFSASDTMSESGEKSTEYVEKSDDISALLDANATEDISSLPTEHEPNYESSKSAKDLYNKRRKQLPERTSGSLAASFDTLPIKTDEEKTSSEETPLSLSGKSEICDSKCKVSKTSLCQKTDFIANYRLAVKPEVLDSSTSITKGKEKDPLIGPLLEEDVSEASHTPTEGSVIDSCKSPAAAENMADSSSTFSQPKLHSDEGCSEEQQICAMCIQLNVITKAEILCLHEDCRTRKLFCFDCFEFFHKRKKTRNHNFKSLKLLMGATAEPKEERNTLVNKKDANFLSTLSSSFPNESLPWHTEQKNLFQMLDVVFDEIDSTAVEKIVVSENEIIRLCNALVADSSTVDGSRINFETLNSLGLTVIGLTGSNKAIYNFLQMHLDGCLQLKFSAMADASVCPPGLYGILPNRNSIFVFYWQSGDRALKDNASVTSQMLKHIRDFCVEIILCYENNDYKSLRFPRFRKETMRTFRDVRLEYSQKVHSAEFGEGFSPVADPDIIKINSLLSSGEGSLFFCNCSLTPKKVEVVHPKEQKYNQKSIKKLFCERAKKDFKIVWKVKRTGQQIPLFEEFLRLAFPEQSKILERLNKEIIKLKNDLTVRLKGEALKKQIDEEEKWYKRALERKVHLFCKTNFSVEENSLKHSKENVSGRSRILPELDSTFEKLKPNIAKTFVDLRRKTLLIGIYLNSKRSLPPQAKQSTIFDVETAPEAVAATLKSELNSSFLPSFFSFFRGQKKTAHFDISLSDSLSDAKFLKQVNDFSLPSAKNLKDLHLKQYRKLKAYWLGTINPFDRSKRTKKLCADSEKEFAPKIDAAESNLRKTVEQLMKGFGKGDLTLTVLEFFQTGPDIKLNYQMEVYGKEEVEYKVHKLELKNNRTRPAVMRLTPRLNGTHLKINKSSVLRALYSISRKNKMIVLVYSKKETENEQEKTDIYVGDWLKLTKNPTKTIFNKDIKTSAFDEETRQLVFFDNDHRLLALYQFSEYFGTLSEAFDEVVNLQQGQEEVAEMHFVSGKQVLLVSRKGRGVIYDLKRRELLQGRFEFGLNLSSVQTYGDFVIAISFENDDMTSLDMSEQLLLESAVPLLSYSISVFLSTDFTQVNDIAQAFQAVSLNCVFRLMEIQEQVHLIAVDLDSGMLQSVSLDLVSPDTPSIVRSQNETEKSVLNKDLEFFYSIFRKYAITNCYEEKVKPLRLTFGLNLEEGTEVDLESVRNNLYRYFCDMFKDLETTTGKSSKQLIVLMNLQVCKAKNFTNVFAYPYQPTSGGQWLLSVISSVPIQIAHAEGNQLRPMSKGRGKSIPPALSSVADVIDSISFGLYEAVYKWSEKPVKVISAKGRQSAGKSFLLNHVAGAQFDISGGRCTQGIWMSVRVLPEATVVALDFEGLGSFERSRQEDVLMAVFGAAVSNLTVFKTGPRFDKDTKKIFDRFQDGASLLKESDTKKQLFKGKLVIVSKDVSREDADGVQCHMTEKIEEIAKAKGNDNFVRNLYNGEFRVATSEPFGSSQFLRSFSDIKVALDNQKPFTEKPDVAVELFKTVLAKVYLQDWTAIDRTRITKRLLLLKSNLDTAVAFGSYTSADSENSSAKLSKFGDFRESSVVPDSLLFGRYDFHLGLYSDEPQVRKSLREKLLKSYMNRESKDIGSIAWCRELEDCLKSLVDRRINRVRMWIQLNIEGYHDDEEVKRLISDAENDYFRPLEQLWAVCRQQCKYCFRLCLERSLHNQGENNSEEQEHDCFTNHRCEEPCFYCLLICGHQAGHPGKHHCKAKSHTCEEICELSRFEGCKGSCSLNIFHEEDSDEKQHRCDSDSHYCDKECSLKGCANSCSLKYNHDGPHMCSISRCPQVCCMKNCYNTCCSIDHFHEEKIKLNGEGCHMCRCKHPCQELCEYSGVCAINAVLREGEEFDYMGYDGGDYHTEQTPERLKCAIIIPSNQIQHKGRHCHLLSAHDVFHFCDITCLTCKNYCTKAYGHAGSHSTNHSTMVNQIFISEDELFSIGERVYEPGESAQNEMCDQFCKRLGRGHTHVMPCPGYHSKYSQERNYVKHNRKGLNPRYEGVLDEVTHHHYWSSINFEDNCSQEENVLFNKCNHFCASQSAKPPNFGSGSETFCQLRLWHDPIPAVPEGQGHVSRRGGHHFLCTHRNAYHTVFVIDSSTSMSIEDQQPRSKTLVYHRKLELNNRLGAVLETCEQFCRDRFRVSKHDYLSLVTFGNISRKHWSGNALAPGFISAALSARIEPQFSSGTKLTPALKHVKTSITDFSCRREGNHQIRCVVIILSDGEIEDFQTSITKIAKIRKLWPSVLSSEPVILTIKFGKDTYGNSNLRDLSSNGIVNISETAAQLKTLFKDFSDKMQQGTIGVIEKPS
eukprot:m.282814 g.282814  ORF g.282814 m.282814 type:complete len:2438 (+) comp40663_c0_seq4:515-7828(+)